MKEEILGEWTFTVSDKFIIESIHDVDSVCTHKMPNRYFQISLIYLDFNFWRKMWSSISKGHKVQTSMCSFWTLTVPNWSFQKEEKRLESGQWCTIKEWLWPLRTEGLLLISNMYLKIQSLLHPLYTPSPLHPSNHLRACVPRLWSV